MLSLTVILGIGSLLAIRTRDSNFPWFTALVVAIAVMSMFGSHAMRFADDRVALHQRPTPEELTQQFFTKPSVEAAPKPVILVATAGAPAPLIGPRPSLANSTGRFQALTIDS